jgi:hypothetical protein
LTAGPAGLHALRPARSGRRDATGKPTNSLTVEYRQAGKRADTPILIFEG